MKEKCQISKDELHDLCFVLHKLTRTSDLTKNMNLWNAINELDDGNYSDILEESLGEIGIFVKRTKDEEAEEKAEWEKKHPKPKPVLIPKMKKGTDFADILEFRGGCVVEFWDKRHIDLKTRRFKNKDNAINKLTKEGWEYIGEVPLF